MRQFTESTARTGGATQPEKRGRGRPRAANPLTPAQRAKRYRDNKRARELAGGDATRSKAKDGAGKAAAELEAAARENERLERLEARLRELQRQARKAKTRIADLSSALDLVVQTASAGKRIPAHVLEGLSRLLAQA